MIRSTRATAAVALTCAALVAFVFPVLAQAPTVPRDVEAADPAEICVACGNAVAADGVRFFHRGRTVVLHAEHCLDAWNDDPDAMFARLQARGALFQEPPQGMKGLAGGWFWLGVWVVAGLVSGALCAYLAVSRGIAPFSWFLAGLAVNVAAVGLLLTRPRGDTSRLPAGIPVGLAKVPTTRSPGVCSSCGAEHHPAARCCARCGRSLEPTVESEVAG